jgi:hypothetical protein
MMRKVLFWLGIGAGNVLQVSMFTIMWNGCN